MVNIITNLYVGVGCLIHMDACKVYLFLDMLDVATENLTGT